MTGPCDDPVNQHTIKNCTEAEQNFDSLELGTAGADVAKVISEITGGNGEGAFKLNSIPSFERLPLPVRMDSLLEGRIDDLMTLVHAQNAKEGIAAFPDKVEALREAIASAEPLDSAAAQKAGLDKVVGLINDVGAGPVNMSIQEMGGARLVTDNQLGHEILQTYVDKITPVVSADAAISNSRVGDYVRDHFFSEGAAGFGEGMSGVIEQGIGNEAMRRFK